MTCQLPPDEKTCKECQVPSCPWIDISDEEQYEIDSEEAISSGELDTFGEEIADHDDLESQCSKSCGDGHK